MENSELDALLSKYRMTFHWGATGLTWWLIRQVNNSLLRSEPQHAKDMESAQAAAVEFIHNMYK